LIGAQLVSPSHPSPFITYDYFTSYVRNYMKMMFMCCHERGLGRKEKAVDTRPSER
jgi:hypothetical protein